MTNEKNITQFSEIETAKDLIGYLESARRRETTKFLHHYTSLDVAVNIIHKQQWHLCSAKSMNDLLEFSSGDILLWKDKLFSSFMGEDNESIAMWSMYGQPWETGVKISIPTGVVHRWIKNIDTLNEISTSSYSPTGRTAEIEKGSLKVIEVAYFNCHDIEDEGEQILTWSNQTNRKYYFTDSKTVELTGYIKNKAWAYEKEHRIMFSQANEYERGSIAIPDDVINSLTVTPSPLFKGDFLSVLSKTIERTVDVRESLFSRKLNIRTICDRCSFDFKPQNA